MDGHEFLCTKGGKIYGNINLQYLNFSNLNETKNLCINADWAILYSLKDLGIAEAQKIQYVQILIRGLLGSFHCNKITKNNNKFMNNQNLLHMKKSTAVLANINQFLSLMYKMCVYNLYIYTHI